MTALSDRGLGGQMSDISDRVPSPKRTRGHGDAETRRGLSAAARRLKKAHYSLKLYVAGATPRSAQATRNIAALCEKHLKGRYKLDIVDIYQRPVLAVDAGILAAPTLVKTLPLPIRRLIGDMGSEQRVLFGLDIKARGEASEARS